MIIPTEIDSLNRPPDSSGGLEAGLRLRPARWEDVEAVAALTLAVCTADGDPAMAISLEDLRQYWKEPRFHIETDAWVVETWDGKIVGYEELYERHAHAAFEGDGYVHPEFLNQGIGTLLLRKLESRARESIQQAEPDLRVTIRNTMGIQDTDARKMHENEGYSPVRFAWRMEINLDGPPAPPHWPEGIGLRPFQMEQARPVFDAMNEAFQDHWGYMPMRYENWCVHHLEREGFDPSLWFVAWEDDQIAGMSLCRHREELGWVGSLCVRRPWRKRGLGLTLLAHSFGEFFQRGTHSIGLGVDAENQSGATRLYQRAGMRVAHEYVHYIKELRPGRDMTEVE